MKRLLALLAALACVCVFAGTAATAPKKALSAQVINVHVMWADWVYTQYANVACESNGGTQWVTANNQGNATCYVDTSTSTRVYANYTYNCFVYYSNDAYAEANWGFQAYVGVVLQQNYRWC